MVNFEFKELWFEFRKKNNKQFAQIQVKIGSLMIKKEIYNEEYKNPILIDHRNKNTQLFYGRHFNIKGCKINQAHNITER